MEKARRNHKGSKRILFTIIVLFLRMADSRNPHRSTTSNGTESTSNTTHLPEIYTSPNSTDAPPPKALCLQGWAIFLICLGAMMAVFLLAAIPLMIYCFLQERHLQPQECPKYNRKIYMAPEEQGFQQE